MRLIHLRLYSFQVLDKPGPISSLHSAASQHTLENNLKYMLQKSNEVSVKELSL